MPGHRWAMAVWASDGGGKTLWLVRLKGHFGAAAREQGRNSRGQARVWSVMRIKNNTAKGGALRAVMRAACLPLRHAKTSSSLATKRKRTNLFKQNVLQLEVPCVDFLAVLKSLGLGLPPVAVRRAYHSLQEEHVTEHRVSTE